MQETKRMKSWQPQSIVNMPNDHREMVTHVEWMEEGKEEEERNEEKDISFSLQSGS